MTTSYASAPRTAGTRAGLAAAAVASLALAPAARAQNIWEDFLQPRADWSVFGGLTHTANATRTEPAGPSDTIFTLGVTGQLERDGRLQARIGASAWYESYLDDTYDDDFLGSMNAWLRYEAIEDRFWWTLENTYGQVTQNTFAAPTPGNRGNANFFSTGPDLSFRLGDQTSLGAGARYGRTDYDFGGIDEQRYSANAGLVRNLSATSSVSVNGSYQRTESDTLLSSEYEIKELFARLETRRARQSLSLDAGYSRVEERGLEEGNPLFRASLYRRLTPFWSLNAGVGSDFRNSSDIVRDALSGVRIVKDEVVYIPPGIDPTFVYEALVDTTLQSRPVAYDYVNLYFDYVRTRTTLSFGAEAGQERYQFAGQSLDRDTWQASAGIARRIRPNISADLGLSYYDRQYVNLASGVGDSWWSANAGVQWQVNPQLSVNFGYRYEGRDTSTGLGEYTDNVLFVGFTYGPGRRAAVAPVPGGTAPASATPRTGP